MKWREDSGVCDLGTKKAFSEALAPKSGIPPRRWYDVVYLADDGSGGP